MSTGPVENAANQLGSPGGVDTQSLGKRRGLVQREIGQFYAGTDVEGRGPCVADQVRRRGHSEKTERKPVDLRVVGTAIVEFPNSGKQFVCRKGQAAHSIDLVDEDDNARRAQPKNNFPQCARETLKWPQVHVLGPKSFQFILEIELLPDAADETVVPLIGS